MKLVYAAYTRCSCGAGMAYDRRISNPIRGAWDCSEILLGRAIPTGQSGAVTHSDRMPFVFWSVLSENSVRAEGATTRPAGE